MTRKIVKVHTTDEMSDLRNNIGNLKLRKPIIKKENYRSIHNPKSDPLRPKKAARTSSDKSDPEWDAMYEAISQHKEILNKSHKNDLFTINGRSIHCNACPRFRAMDNIVAMNGHVSNKSHKQHIQSWMALKEIARLENVVKSQTEIIVQLKESNQQLKDLLNNKVTETVKLNTQPPESTQQPIENAKKKSNGNQISFEDLQLTNNPTQVDKIQTTTNKQPEQIAKIDTNATPADQKLHPAIPLPVQQHQNQPTPIYEQPTPNPQNYLMAQYNAISQPNPAFNLADETICQQQTLTSTHQNTQPAQYPTQSFGNDQFREFYHQMQRENRTSKLNAVNKSWQLIPYLSALTTVQAGGPDLITALKVHFSETIDRDAYKKLIKQYSLQIKYLAHVMEKNAPKSLKAVQKKLINDHLLQYSKCQHVFRQLATSIDLDMSLFYNKNEFKHAIAAKRDDTEDLHQNWQGQLQTVWDSFYRVHPLTRLIFFICLSTGCRFEDLFNLRVSDIQNASHSNEKERKPLTFKFGKVNHKFHRQHIFPESIINKIRTQITKLGRRSAEFFIGCRNTRNKDKLRKHLGYHIDSMILQRPADLQKTLKSLNLNRFHNFRVTTYNIGLQTTIPPNLLKQHMGWVEAGTAKWYDKGPQIASVKQISEAFNIAIPWGNFKDGKSDEVLAPFKDKIEQYVIEKLDQMKDYESSASDGEMDDGVEEDSDY